MPEQPVEGGTSYLNVPRAADVTFARNFVRVAVCELRIPAIVELDRAALDRFRKAIQAHLPRYETQKSIEVSLDEATTHTVPEFNHRFLSKRGETTLLLRPQSLVLEIRKYRSFEEFKKLLLAVVEAAVPVIDADFFVRVGLRYVDVVPFDLSDFASLAGWVNPVLATPLIDGTYGDVSEYMQVVRGKIPHGGYTFRHGLPQEPLKAGPPGYVLDLDFYAPTVDAADVGRQVDLFHRHAFSLFMWALGPRALEHLGPGAAKPR